MIAIHFKAPYTVVVNGHRKRLLSFVVIYMYTAVYDRGGLTWVEISWNCGRKGENNSGRNSQLYVRYSCPVIAAEMRKKHNSRRNSQL